MGTFVVWLWKISGNLDTWFDSAAPAQDVLVHGVYDAKAFEFVELANSYHLEVVLALTLVLELAGRIHFCQYCSFLTYW